MSANFDEYFDKDINKLVRSLLIYITDIELLSTVHKKRLISGFETCIRNTFKDIYVSYHELAFNDEFIKKSEACFYPAITIAIDQNKSVNEFWVKFNLKNQSRKTLN